jgi:hypothetical protein
MTGGGKFMTFVVAARNDTYGGNFVGRMQIFINTLVALWNKYNLDAELIVVEWNPPEHRPRLGQAIAWPKLRMPGMIQIVEVPERFHNRLPNSDRMPIFEYIAKNVGIRRATGQYVLATNPDIVFTDRIMQHFAARTFREDSFYRVDRYDVLKEIPLDLPVGKQLELCARHAFRVHRMEGSFPLRRSARLRNYAAQNLPRLMPHRLIRGALRRAGRLLISDPPNGAEPTPTAPAVHTNASGDFLLMSAKRWRALRGYPELGTHSHIDSYMVYLAATAGLRQTILPYPIYHQEHDRSEQNARPLTVLNQLPALRRMLETGNLEIPNDENWGLGNSQLLVHNATEALLLGEGTGSSSESDEKVKSSVASEKQR